MRHCLQLNLMRLLAAASLATLLAIDTVSAQSHSNTVFRIGTGGTTGTYFKIGSLIAQVIGHDAQFDAASAFRNTLALAQRSSGSVANVRDIEEGRVESALVQSDVAHWAYHGTGPFKDSPKLSKLRVISTLYLESVHLIASVNTKIDSVEALEGYRVSIDEVDSGTRLNVLHILRAHGLSDSDIKPVYLKPADSMLRLRQGQLDAFFFVGGYPLAGVSDLVASGHAKVIPISGPHINQLVKDYLFFTDDAIPSGTYSNDQVLPTLAVPAQLVISANMSEETVYQITKLLWKKSTLSYMRDHHPKARDMKIESAQIGVGIPLHPGAKRFFLERGLLLDGLAR